MLIRTLTITGADDKVPPEFLYGITHAHSKDLDIEWGILASKSNAGKSRYPSREWIDKLIILGESDWLDMSLHICGSWMREILMGQFSIDLDLDHFSRVQLNFRENAKCDLRAFKAVIEGQLSHSALIFQLDFRGNKIYSDLIGQTGEKHDCLLDCSGGKGVLTPWRRVVEGNPGYAGGLTPDNLLEQLTKIRYACESDTRGIWIDIESGVRNAKNDLDFDKVFRVIDIVEKWNKEECRRVH